jgi:putative PIN family toxin of toxin-antitoxin system
VRRIVLDTNVLLAGLRSRTGASFRLLSLIGASAFETVVSVPLVLEYEAILMRHARELGLTRQDVEDTIDYLCQVSELREIHFLWRPTLRDPGDEFVLELAVAAGCHCIVTHNTRDFDGAEAFGVSIVTPREFLRLMETTT